MTDDLFSDDYDDTDTESESEDTESTDDTASGDSASEDEAVAKRIRELQSKADKAEARANKLAKELSKGNTSSAKGDETPDGTPPEVKEWLETTQTNFRDDLYKEDPRFAKFDLDPSLISGTTPSELRASQKQLVEFVDKLEGQIRDAVLVEHGFKPEPKASERQAPTNYATMTSEEFAKIEAKALSGGMLRRSNS